jgi:hypothetical protein
MRLLRYQVVFIRVRVLISVKPWVQRCTGESRPDGNMFKQS